MSLTVSDHASLNPNDAMREREHLVLANAWEGAKITLDHMLGLLDPPAVIARSKTVRPSVRWMMRDWLRCLEILVRRLLFITALGLVLPATRLAGAPNAVRTPQTLATDDPASWGVCLRFFRSSPKQRQSTTYPAQQEAPTEWDALPFARRLEALCRIIAKPQRRARTLARKLERIRAANVGRNAPRSFGVRDWHIHSSIRTPAQDFITDLMDGTERLIERVLARWQEPG